VTPLTFSSDAQAYERPALSPRWASRAAGLALRSNRIADRADDIRPSKREDHTSPVDRDARDAQNQEYDQRADRIGAALNSSR
jgi:hypothetical protein